MKWKMKEARYGDIVRVQLGAIYHFGIFVTEDEVIQFGLPPTPNRKFEDVAVISSPVEDFLGGGFLEVGVCEGHEKRRRNSPDKTVAAARSRLGEKGYDIIHNNCEHFANECAFGEKFSSMTESLRERFRAIPIVHVYVSRLPFEVENDRIVPQERADEIAGCSNPDVRSRKYYVWKLLERALLNSFGLKLDELKITRSENGKWECPSYCFSLSHSGDMVAVAVSRKPVGVDIEKCDYSRFTDALAEKTVTKSEGEALSRFESGRAAALNALWTKKEAIFKLSGGKAFQPKRIETSQFSTVTKTVRVANESYFISVASEDADRANFRGDGLEFINYEF